jgi:hypothetical protein
MSLPPRPAPSLPDVARDCRITAAAAAAASAGPPSRLHRSGGHPQVRPRVAAARPGLIPACRFWSANRRACGLARPGDRTGPAPRLARVRRCRTVRDAGAEFGRRASARVADARPAGSADSVEHSVLIVHILIADPASRFVKLGTGADHGLHGRTLRRRQLRRRGDRRGAAGLSGTLARFRRGELSLPGEPATAHRLRAGRRATGAVGSPRYHGRRRPGRRSRVRRREADGARLADGTRVTLDALVVAPLL